MYLIYILHNRSKNKFQANPCRIDLCSVQGRGGGGESELDTAYTLACNNLYIIYICKSKMGTQEKQ